MRKFHKKRIIPVGLSRLHTNLINLGSKIQIKSEEKFQKEKHIGAMIHEAFTRIIAYAIILHRGIYSLCKEGWTSLTPLLLRAILDCSINCIIIIDNNYPEYMAFKFLAFDHLKIMKEKNPSKYKEEKIYQEMRSAIEKIENNIEKEKAERFLEKRKLGIYWFKPEERRSKTKIIEEKASDNMKFLYNYFSSVTHASTFGMFSFQDAPFRIDINPILNPKRTKEALLFSCRLLLELLDIRNTYEELGFDSEYNQFRDNILEFQKK